MLRAVLCERIAVYLDNLGSVTCDVPPIKGLLPPSVWPSRSWIEVAPPALSGMQSLSGGIATVLEDIGPPIVGDPPPGTPTSPSPSAIAWAKSLDDGTTVTLEGKVVTAATHQVASGCIYIEEPDRSAGIRVNTNSAFAVGEAVNVSGEIGTSDGERVVQATSITSLGMTTPIPPIGVINRDIGGGDWLDVLENGLATEVGEQGGEGRRARDRHERIPRRWLSSRWGTLRGATPPTRGARRPP